MGRGKELLRIGDFGLRNGNRKNDKAFTAEPAEKDENRGSDNNGRNRREIDRGQRREKHWEKGRNWGEKMVSLRRVLMEKGDAEVGKAVAEEEFVGVRVRFGGEKMM